eukprot:SAG22_NODE_19629_length_273_cov_0.597701_1_plen_83_part_01
MATNFRGVVELTDAVLPLLLRAPEGTASVLSTSSGVGARALGLVSEAHRAALQDEALDEEVLSGLLSGILRDLGREPAHPYHS